MKVIHSFSSDKSKVAYRGNQVIFVSNYLEFFYYASANLIHTLSKVGTNMVLLSNTSFFVTHSAVKPAAYLHSEFNSFFKRKHYNIPIKRTKI